MKYICLIIMAAAVAFNAPAAEVAKASATPVEWFNGVSVSGVGAIRQADFASGHSELGAGVQVGLALNKNVTLEGRVLAYEESAAGNEGDKWQGDVVDEIAIGARYNLLASENKKLSLDGVAGGDRSQQLDDWGFHVGLAASWHPVKQVSVTIQREIRTWFKNDHDHLTSLSIGYTF